MDAEQTTSTTKTAPRKRPATRRKTAAQPAAAPQGRYFNRDESWLLFNDRVLEEAQDATNPLLERVKFLSITGSNLDEFVEIRVAGILQMIEDGDQLPATPDEGGLTQQERLTALRRQLHAFASRQAACWTDKIEPALAEENIRVVRWKHLRKSERAFATKFFNEQVDPLLTPVTLDPSHPFPRVLNKAIGLALLLRVKRKTASARALHAGHRHHPAHAAFSPCPPGA